jgi:hypothetical protein
MAIKRKYTGFLPAKKLNLTPKVRTAAIKVLRMMESGQIIDKDEEPPPLGQGCRFDMSLILSRSGRGNECGSVGCLAGWIAHVLSQSPTKAIELYRTLRYKSDELDRLVHAEAENGITWIYSAKTKHGARALRNYLTTGKANWRKAMGADA